LTTTCERFNGHPGSEEGARKFSLLLGGGFTIAAMRYRLRTLLIVLALGPPVLAGAWLFGPTLWEFWNEEHVTALGIFLYLSAMVVFAFRVMVRWWPESQAKPIQDQADENRSPPLDH
jgi:hypothetical protein